MPLRLEINTVAHTPAVAADRVNVHLYGHIVGLEGFKHTQTVFGGTALSSADSTIIAGGVVGLTRRSAEKRSIIICEGFLKAPKAFAFGA